MTSDSFHPWLNEYYARFRVGGAGWQPPRPLDVCFVIGSLGISGGTYVILEHAKYLQQHGASVTVIPTINSDKPPSKWHPALDEITVATFEDVADRTFDVVIPTWWPTVYELPKLQFRHAVYLVQSIESRFYAQSDNYSQAVMAEMTYRLGLPAITIARWMETYLSLEHGMPTFLVRNGISKERYSARGPAFVDREPGKVRALVEGPVGPSMKGVAEAIDACRTAGFAETWLLTSSEVKEVPGVDRVFSQIPAAETAFVYRSTDVLVKLSQVEGMYGPPLEMFHCGGTVATWDVTGCEEYVIDGYNGVIHQLGDFDGLQRSLRRLASDTEFLDELKANALGTAASWPDWERASQDFYAYLFAIAAGTAIDSADLALRISGVPNVVSIARTRSGTKVLNKSQSSKSRAPGTPPSKSRKG